MLYQPTRDPLVINRRRLLGFLGGAVAAGIISRDRGARLPAGCLREDRRHRRRVEHRDDQRAGRHPQLRHRRRSACPGSGIDRRNDPVLERRPDRGLAADYQGPLPGVPRYLRTVLSEHHPRQPERWLQRPARQDPHGSGRWRGAGRGQDADPLGRRVRGARRHRRGDRLEDFGWTAEQFWPGALKSVTWEGKIYGIPTNNETMAFIWNKQIFADAGLDPESPPATWDDVVAYSNQIKQETGKNGYGMVAKVNAGNTPFRFMPVLWAYGASALDEASRRADLRNHHDQHAGGDRRAAGQLRHVCPRPVGADLGADQYADREPGPVHRRRDRHDDQPPQRVRRHDRPRRRRRPAPTRSWPTRSWPTCPTA